MQANPLPAPQREGWRDAGMCSVFALLTGAGTWELCAMFQFSLYLL